MPNNQDEWLHQVQLLICFVPDVNTGAPYLALGMTTEFDIS